MNLPLGELAALGTSVCWTISAFCFEVGAQRIGALMMSFVRVSIALAMLSVLTIFIRGTPLPTEASSAQLGWLALSGLVGLVLGDLCLFRSYLEIGARRAMLVQTTSPIFTVLLGWALLGERPRPLAALGTVLVLTGCTWAIRERTAARARALADTEPAAAARPAATGHVITGNLGLGLTLALGGALGQAGGLVLSKHGMHGMHPIAATQIRMMAAVAGFAVVITAISAWPRVRAALGDRRGISFTALGSVFGPTIGVSLSLAAIAHTQAGIAAALIATQQVWMVVATLLLGRERVGVGGFGGAVLAVAGVILLVVA
jgi:drug/metabolite transporter (DMT)-like permease